MGREKRGRQPAPKLTLPAIRRALQQMLRPVAKPDCPYCRSHSHPDTCLRRSFPVPIRFGQIIGGPVSPTPPVGVGRTVDPKYTHLPYRRRRFTYEAFTAV